MTDYPKLAGSDRFQPADFVINRYVAQVPVDTTLADVLHPQYFESHLNRLRPLMEIAVISEDQALDAVIRVVSVGKTMAKCRVLHVYCEPEPIEGAEVAPVSTPFVEWAGPQHKWRVIHGGNIIDHGFTTKEEAQIAADAYVAKMNG